MIVSFYGFNQQRLSAPASPNVTNPNTEQNATTTTTDNSQSWTETNIICSILVVPACFSLFSFFIILSIDPEPELFVKAISMIICFVSIPLPMLLLLLHICSTPATSLNTAHVIEGFETMENDGVCDKKKKNWVILKLSEIGRTSSPNLDMVVTGEAEKEKRMLEAEKDDDGDDDMEEFFCSICLCEYERSEVIVKLPCSHIFHEDCISTWTCNHFRCPLCNFDLVANYDNGSTDDLEEGE